MSLCRLLRSIIVATQIFRETRTVAWKDVICYESMLKGLSKEATLVLSNTRELDRVPSTE